MYTVILKKQDIAAKIRQELEVYFPSIPFQVETEPKDGSIKVSYTNGVPKAKVRNVVNQFERSYPNRLKICIERYMGNAVKEKLLEETKLVWGVDNIKESSWLKPANMLVATYIQMIFNCQDY